MVNVYSKRMQKSVQTMTAAQMNHMIVASRPNLVYLTGQELDTGERLSCLLLDGEANPKFFVHQMFAGQLRLPDEVEVILWRDEDHPVELLSTYIGQQHQVGVDQNWPSAFLIDLMKAHPSLKIAKSGIVEKQRECKDEAEINTLRQSSRIADAVMHQVLELQYLPTTERQMGETIRSFFAEHQAHELSFKPIIGFGPNTANPHHELSDAGLLPEQAIVLDIGGIFQHYCSDITRTVFYGKPNERFAEIYQIVREAQEKAIAMVKPGVRFADIDLMIRREFAKWNYAEYFTHRTGHGLGLELHEGPFLHAKNTDQMQAGMVFSIEPGIYLPGEFGVRIEDIVVVTETGCEVLTLSPKEVQYLDVKVE